MAEANFSENGEAFWVISTSDDRPEDIQVIGLYGDANQNENYDDDATQDASDVSNRLPQLITKNKDIERESADPNDQRGPTRIYS